MDSVDITSQIEDREEIETNENVENPIMKVIKKYKFIFITILIVLIIVGLYFMLKPSVSTFVSQTNNVDNPIVDKLINAIEDKQNVLLGEI